RIGGFLARANAAARPSLGAAAPEQDQQASSGLPRLRSPAVGLRDRPTPCRGTPRDRASGHPARRPPRFLPDRPRRRRPAGPAASAPRPRRGARRGAERSNGSPSGRGARGTPWGFGPTAGTTSETGRRGRPSSPVRSGSPAYLSRPGPWRRRGRAMCQRNGVFVAFGRPAGFGPGPLGARAKWPPRNRLSHGAGLGFSVALLPGRGPERPCGGDVSGLLSRTDRESLAGRFVRRRGAGGGPGAGAQLGGRPRGPGRAAGVWTTFCRFLSGIP